MTVFFAGVVAGESDALLETASVVSLDSCDLRGFEVVRLREDGVGVAGDEVTLSEVRALPLEAGVSARLVVLFLRERRAGVLDWLRERETYHQNGKTSAVCVQ